ncbi:MAG: hypothetical protein ACT4OO_04410 [Nitrospiraceae bacterium]
MMDIRSFILVMILSLSACAGPQPILQSNSQRQLYGKEAAEQAIDACERKADEAGVTHGANRAGNMASGAAIAGILGAGVGAASGLWAGGAGVALGAAIGGGTGVILGAVGGAYKPVQPDQTYASFVTRCLKDKGYQVDGWE